MDYKKFIDSVVGNIARKIEDEFNENDHPRDKGGKFTTKGSEGKGGSRRQEHGFYGGEKVKQEDPKRGDELNKYAVKLEKAGVDPKEIHRLNREGDLEGMKKLLPETETEKAAKEELSEQGSNEHDQIAEKLSADASSADEFLTRMGYDNFDIGDEEEILGLIKKAFKNNPNKALKVAGDYIELGSEASSPKNSSKNVDKLVDAAMEGLMDDYDLGLDFLRAMRVRTKDLYNEEGEIDEDVYADKIEKAIRNNPEKAADNLEQLGDILYEEDE